MITATQTTMLELRPYLMPGKEPNKFICPICGNNDLSIEPKTGKFFCFNEECTPKEIYKATLRRAGIPQHTTPYHDVVRPLPVLDLLPVGVPQIIVSKHHKREGETDYYIHTETFRLVKKRGINPQTGKKYSPFFQHLHPDGQWRASKGDEKPVPFCLEEILKIPGTKTIIFTEGESDAIAGINIGLKCASHKNAWDAILAQLLEYCKSCNKDEIFCIIISDNDKSGEQQAAKFSARLTEHGFNNAIIPIKDLYPEVQEKGDLKDWITDTMFDNTNHARRIEERLHEILMERYAVSTLSTPEKPDKFTKLKQNRIAIEKQLKGLLKWNELLNQVEYKGKRFDAESFQFFVSEECNLAMTEQNARDCIITIAKMNKYNPAKDSMISAINDALGTNYCIHDIKEILNNKDVNHSILNNMSTAYLGNTSEIANIYMKKFMIGAVARLFEPGCKMDNMLVLQSHNQGLNKSRFFEVLFTPEFFADSPVLNGDKDSLMIMHRKQCIEVSELETMHSKRQVGEIKSFLSRHTDYFRVPYGTSINEYPRMCVLVGTVNDAEFLRDKTGNRRFWTIALNKIADIAQLEKDRGMLWAAAMVAFLMGELWYLTPEESALSAESNKDFEEEDQLKELVLHALRKEGGGDINKAKFTMMNLLNQMPISDDLKLSQGTRKRVANILHELGFESKNTKVNNIQAKRWSKVNPINYQELPQLPQDLGVTVAVTSETLGMTQELPQLPQLPQFEQNLENNHFTIISDGDAAKDESLGVTSNPIDETPAQQTVDTVTPKKTNRGNSTKNDVTVDATTLGLSGKVFRNASQEETKSGAWVRVAGTKSPNLNGNSFKVKSTDKNGAVIMIDKKNGILHIQWRYLYPSKSPNS